MNTRILAALMLAVAVPCFAEPGVDARIHPGDDFFAYANGEWLAATAIPEGLDRWNARTEIDAVTREQMAKVFETAAAAPTGTLARQVADFRAAWANEAAIEARGLASLRQPFDRIERVHDKAALTQLLGAGLRADVDPLNSGSYDSAHLLGLAVEEGNYGEKTYVAYLVQGGLGMPDRDHYVDPAPDKQALRAKYQAYIGRLLSLGGFDRSAQRAETVMALETAIALSHATAEASARDQNAGNLWSRADFARDAPGMDWSAFFAAAGLSKREKFVVWQPGAIKGAAALVESQPLEAWKDYLRFKVLDTRAELLPRSFADEAFAFHGAVLTGLATQRPRAERALAATNLAMSEAIGRLYVEQNFSPRQKVRLNTLNANVVAAFAKRVESATWMSPATRAIALAKLKTLYVGLGYPETWRDYSSVRIDPSDAWGNFERLSEWNYQRAIARLEKPVDKKEWRIAPQAVGAMLVFQQSAYNFTAALLQPPKFDASASDAASYGAIGAILGHDVSHFVDTLGAEYDVDGAARRWWSAEDFVRYEKASDAFVKQFESYRPFADQPINGKATLVENVADLAGLNAAFDAYRATLGAKSADKAFVKQQDREFFLGFARAWRGKMREDALRKYLASDHHAPEAFRIATVRNIDAWYEAFDVKTGHRLYLAPESRVRVW